MTDPQQRLTISLCMIVKNEEKHLARCLDSVQGVVDEILIVDTGSTDRTIEIARAYDAKISHFEWIHDFAAARNFAIEQATSEYVLVLDADEYLDEEQDLQRDIREEQGDFFVLRIKNYSSVSIATFHPAVRLFKNHIGLYYFGRIHEHLSIEDGDYKYAYGKTTIHHVGYTQEVFDEKNKLERNQALLVKAVEENPSGYNLFNLGMQYKVQHDFEQALDAFKRSFYMSKDRMYITPLLYNMADCLRELKRYEESIALVRDAIDSFPNYTDLYYEQARLYDEYGYLKDAERSYAKCVELGEVTYIQSIEGIGSYISRLCLADLYFKQGRRVEALQTTFDVLQEKPDYLVALGYYLEILTKTKIAETAIAENLKAAYPLRDRTALNNLLSVLYNKRHPLLQRFLTEFNVQVESNVQLVAKQLTGNTQAAREGWLTFDGAIPAEHQQDVLVLAFLLQDADLLALVRTHFNLSDDEWSALQKVVLRQAFEPHLVSTVLQNLLKHVVPALIVMGEGKALRDLLPFAAGTTVKARLQMARLLGEYNEFDLAVELLLNLHREDPSQPEALELLGDLSYRQGHFVDAFGLYNRLLDIKQEYGTFLRIYNLYAKMNDQEGMLLIQKEMSRRFPLSVWAASAHE